MNKNISILVKCPLVLFFITLFSHSSLVIDLFVEWLFGLIVEIFRTLLVFFNYLDPWSYIWTFVSKFLSLYSCMCCSKLFMSDSVAVLSIILWSSKVILLMSKDSVCRLAFANCLEWELENVCTSYLRKSHRTLKLSTSECSFHLFLINCDTVVL